ncbi:hypothetical protein Riv7116_1461 [Rivularia sp. PCC 7116]|uniref:hypothetical protein n=1 Tax=Rivularia sp. PCC 7116 TaxID=373994 RepID=UPI00029EDDEB|nr:hypothetical protein [Rivularia sp. PCC 7116]AFY54022.1 hypothetical protein Riv7116_1461 [Rivularia sp. PCC 7116]
MSEAADAQTTDESNQGSGFSKFKKILIGIVIATIAGAALYGAGWFQARSQFSSDDDEIKQELQQTKELLNTATNRAYLMEARGDLYDTTVNLDERNFGMANTRLQEAAAALGKIEDTDGNLNIDKIQELQEAVAKKNINVAVNLEQQRNTVLSYINVLNKLIPAEGNLEIPAAEETPQQ